jgi:hypothetical protein
MSDVAAAAKSAKSSAAPAAPAKPAQTLREVKPKTFSPSSLKPLGYGDTEIMTITVPAGWTFEDVLKPVAWTSVVNPIAANSAKTQIDRIGSLIYVSTVDNTFLAWLRINRIQRDNLNNPCGVDVMCVGPSIDLKTGEPRPLNLRTGKAWVDPVKSDASE